MLGLVLMFLALGLRAEDRSSEYAQKIAQCLAREIPCAATLEADTFTKDSYLWVKTLSYSIEVWLRVKDGKRTLQMDVWKRDKSKLIEWFVDNGADGVLNDAASHETGIIYTSRLGPLPRHYRAHLAELVSVLFPQ